MCRRARFLLFFVSDPFPDTQRGLNNSIIALRWPAPPLKPRRCLQNDEFVFRSDFIVFFAFVVLGPQTPRVIFRRFSEKRNFQRSSRNANKSIRNVRAPEVCMEIFSRNCRHVGGLICATIKKWKSFSLIEKHIQIFELLCMFFAKNNLEIFVKRMKTMNAKIFQRFK